MPASVISARNCQLWREPSSLDPNKKAPNKSVLKIRPDNPEYASDDNPTQSGRTKSMAFSFGSGS